MWLGEECLGANCNFFFNIKDFADDNFLATNSVNLAGMETLEQRDAM